MKSFGFNLIFLTILIIFSFSTTNVVLATEVSPDWARKLIEEGKKPEAFKPENGYIPDSSTAIKVAVSVWIPIYGNEQIINQKPYKAILIDGYWIVSGTLKKNLKGGVAYAVINKISGEINFVTHTR